MMLVSSYQEQKLGKRGAPLRKTFLHEVVLCRYDV